MTDCGDQDLQMIELALLADDPQFISRFQRATEQLDAGAADAPQGPILVAVDGTLESMQAVHWAAKFARTSRAEIRIVHAVRLGSGPIDQGVSDPADLNWGQPGEAICHSAVDLASAVAPASRVYGTIFRGAPGPAIVLAAKGAALIVLRSSGLGLLRSLLCGSALPYVLDRARCAVAVLPAAERIMPQSPTAASRVMVGVDGGAGDRAALAEAVWIASAGSFELLAVCAPGAEQATRTALARLRRHASVPAVELLTAADRLVDTLAELAPSAQAIVCDRSQVALNKPWRGRGGRRLIRGARCPVLLTYTAANDQGDR